MSSFIDKINPRVNKSVLKFLAGFLWLGTGILLSVMGLKWVLESSSEYALYYGLGGLAASLLIHYLGFSRIVARNLERIKSIDGKYCLFGFMSWKSYLIIAVMMTMGITLRHSSIEKEYLSVIYIGIGTALVLSSLRYFREM